ncbi:probable serine/threonine-protein kinase SIS8 [Cryptomeria japonica]|uniref:probable serine/threonine-protein kinase SIS8 n=1 Tax=Cryptomeria japonica TaxID=3369 RepID=UPI0027D9D118|nr:probable serine/threonine-protein kinase SIS8 [Cryptomeria japonica]XP_057850098.2 probable serine/threonine-protein kinase SIS8 [Cryptomeria japonica]XP_057850100.2 probable serine/threonine-protein kinase SIS8 [Cryptomeria japonica]XP_057850101.2 probable serine/threonine-protein kinase SIS8 [Cryptomeria japonica]XP_057850102.2 probable serine/threonine-protein kinase SIS8 [Cryptomeria japonica]
MRNLLRKLHIGGSHSEDTDGSKSPKGRFAEGMGPSQRGKLSPSESPGSSSTLFEQKPFSSLSGWLAPMTRHSSSSASNISPSGSSGGSSAKDRLETLGSASATPSGSFDMGGSELVSTNVGDTQAADPAMEEEYQIQLAMALSVNDDPEAVQIEAVKQISLGSSSSTQNTSAEVVAYRYWNYNALNYDDNVVDDFYDLYGVVSDSKSDKMPSLIDLQGIPLTEDITWEAVLVNRALDLDLAMLEKKALALAVESNARTVSWTRCKLVQKLADLVSDNMGGPVGDPDDMLRRWRRTRHNLRATLRNMVLPLGQLKVGLARHRALLFKVLADCVGIPCRLVKGRYYMGTDDGAVNIIKVNEREYIVDLMGAPGTLIPVDATGTIPPQIKSENTLYTINESVKDVEVDLSASSKGRLLSSVADCSHDESSEERRLDSGKMASELSGSVEIFRDSQGNAGGIGRFQGGPIYDESRLRLESDENSELHKLERLPPRAYSGRSSYPYSHARSPSWTEGIGSPAVRRMKVKDVSQYMMDAAKENPGLAQKLHDVLLESGVVAPPNLFTEISAEQLQAQVTEDKKIIEDKINEKRKRHRARRADKSGLGPSQLLPPVPRLASSTKDGDSREHLQRLNSVEGLGDRRPLELVDPIPVLLSSDCSQAASSTTTGTSSLAATVQDTLPPELIRHVPVAAAAAATAAVVASSMVVAASKTNVDQTLEVPVAAAATATAAVVVATSAAVGRRYEQLDHGVQIIEDPCDKVADGGVKSVEANGAVRNSQGSYNGKEAVCNEAGPANRAGREDERSSDKSNENESTKSDMGLDDVAEWEIPWEDITLGERIGLGSYGEVYRGDWHGTEVAVKKFLDQDISGDALEEFRSEVRIMKRLRHPNVVLFMGAITRAPNLSIVTEFLPRGSLYRLIHRPNNQLDEKKRLRMALDVAKGMNYLHSSTPVIVHRDLKSPNLLVDKNWVVKVCDFGLSRMKHNTFLSSKSTAGTAEWMAPEVLRNEPSNEKCDVYSFGVILWELTTLQQPWGGMNPMQVVGAVGFQHRQLDIPNDMDPTIADIIRQCWHTDPKLRPSFSDIMTALRTLQRSSLSTQASRLSVSNNRSSVLPKGQAPTKIELHAKQNHLGQGLAASQTELQNLGDEDTQPIGS